MFPRIDSRLPFAGLALALIVMPAACVRTTPPAPPAPDVRAMVAAIDLAGQRDTSPVQVVPLRNGAVSRLLAQAAQARTQGQYARAASLLDAAMQDAPQAPEVLQARAEIAVLRRHYQRAEALARRSYALGPKLGSLCMRNWQTVMEMRYVAHDAAGIEVARKRRDACRVKPVTRM